MRQVVSAGATVNREKRPILKTAGIGMAGKFQAVPRQDHRPRCGRAGRHQCLDLCLPFAESPRLAGMP